MNYGLVLGLYDDSSREVSYNCLYLYPTSFQFTQTNFLDPRSDYFSPFLNVARETPKLGYAQWVLDDIDCIRVKLEAENVTLPEIPAKTSGCKGRTARKSGAGGPICFATVPARGRVTNRTQPESV